jgi:hypothetical protein
MWRKLMINWRNIFSWKTAQPEWVGWLVKNKSTFTGITYYKVVIVEDGEKLWADASTEGEDEALALYEDLKINPENAKPCGQGGILSWSLKKGTKKIRFIEIPPFDDIQVTAWKLDKKFGPGARVKVNGRRGGPFLRRLEGKTGTIVSVFDCGSWNIEFDDDYRHEGFAVYPVYGDDLILI